MEGEHGRQVIMRQALLWIRKVQFWFALVTACFVWQMADGGGDEFVVIVDACGEDCTMLCGKGAGCGWIRGRMPQGEPTMFGRWMRRLLGS